MAENESDYYIVMECSGKNVGYKHTMVILTMGDCMYVDSFEFPGLTGMEKMASIMQKLRDNPPAELAGHKVVKVTDYKKPEETGLPAANVLIYSLENGATVVVRPSGTEPKIKTYFTTLGKDLAEAQAQKDALAAAIEPILK